MKRYLYGQNFTTMNSGKFNLLNFMGTLEVAPGDTVSGRTQVHTWSDTTAKPVMNRTYTDTYAFYIPYRLLWDQFPEFITDSETTLVPPQIPPGQELKEYMEEQTRTTGVVAWNRRAYNLIYNKFFRLPYQTEVDLDDPFLKSAPVRETTFHESCYELGTIPDTSVAIDVTGETVSIDALREGFAKDRFDKIRGYYGSKYVDYLAALGVKASWSITDDPEPVAKANKDFQFRTIAATAQETVGEDTNVGDPAGYFNAQHSMQLRPTFAPEHGMIVFVSVARMDIPNRVGNVAYNLCGTNVNQYYTPERETVKVRDVCRLLFSPGSVEAETRQYEWLRKPAHQVGLGTNANADLLYFATRDDVDAGPFQYRNLPLDTFTDLFTGNMGGSQSVEYCQFMTHRLRKKSPVRPPARISGVS